VSFRAPIVTTGDGTVIVCPAGQSGGGDVWTIALITLAVAAAVLAAVMVGQMIGQQRALRRGAAEVGAGLSSADQLVILRRQLDLLDLRRHRQPTDLLLWLFRRRR
jgi:hypothetical protein